MFLINAIPHAECNITELDVISITILRKQEPRAKAEVSDVT